MRNFVVLGSFYLSILAALFSDGRMEARFLLPYGGFLLLGLVAMAELDKKVHGFFRDFGQLWITRRF